MSDLVGFGQILIFDKFCQIGRTLSDSVELGRTRLDRHGSDLVGFCWIRLDLVRFGRILSDSVGFSWIWLDSFGFGQILSDLVRFGWIRSDSVDLVAFFSGICYLLYLTVGTI